MFELRIYVHDAFSGGLALLEKGAENKRQYARVEAAFTQVYAVKVLWPNSNLGVLQVQDRSEACFHSMKVGPFTMHNRMKSTH
jgi:hypothetical protein